MLSARREGFTLVEITVALVILALGILGISASAGKLSGVTGAAKSEATALQAVNDRLSLVLLHPNYGGLDSIFTATETNVPAPGFLRVTDVVRTVTTGSGGKKTDFTDITVTVSGPGLVLPVTRTQTVGAP